MIHPVDTALPGSIAVDFNPQRAIPGLERLSVYAEGYEIRFREGLSETYEAVHRVIGEARFAELAKAYAAQYPSRNPNLSFVGEHLPQFIGTLPLAKELPFIADLAKLEWLVSEAFHAFEKPAVGAHELSKISPEKLTQAVFIFQPSVAVVSSDWPVLDIWNLRKKPKEEINLEINGRAQRVMVYRRGFKVECRLLTEWQLEMLEGLLQGLSLEAVCGKLAEKFSDDLTPATAWFSSLTQDGLIVATSSISPP